MHILFLGAPCPVITTYLTEIGHTFAATQEPLDIAWIKEQSFDFGISYRYMHIIRQEVIDFFADRLINMHISYLPWNRGKDPNLWSYLEDSPRGVTIHRVDAGLDTGDILLQQELAIDLENDTLRTSYEKLSRAIEALFMEHANLLLDNALTPRKQPMGGSFHLAKDKNPYIYLIEELWWDTPVKKCLKKQAVNPNLPPTK